jgi:hypothetical protein
VHADLDLAARHKTQRLGKFGPARNGVEDFGKLVTRRQRSTSWLRTARATRCQHTGHAHMFDE